MLNNLWQWWQALSLKEGVLFLFWVMLGISFVYWICIRIYMKGHEDGWAKGYVRGKAVASERHFD